MWQNLQMIQRRLTVLAMAAGCAGLVAVQNEVFGNRARYIWYWYGENADLYANSYAVWFQWFEDSTLSEQFLYWTVHFASQCVLYVGILLASRMGLGWKRFTTRTIWLVAILFAVLR